MIQIKTIAMLMIAIAAIGAIGITIGTTTQAAHAQTDPDNGATRTTTGSCGEHCVKTVTTPTNPNGDSNTNSIKHNH